MPSVVYKYNTTGFYYTHLLRIVKERGALAVHRMTVPSTNASGTMKRKLAEQTGSSSSTKKSKNACSSVSSSTHHGHWSAGLKTSIADPELLIEEDEKIVIIKDKYPKARKHFLVLPKESISSLKKLTREHIPLLEHMEKKGREIAKKSALSLNFRYGYHAVPSMSYIHLHVISQDFDSPCLKTKKHWNSFTSDYFIDSEDLIDMIKQDGKYEVNTSRYQELLKQDLKCHVCDKGCSTMPSLKKHILLHMPKST